MKKSEKFSKMFERFFRLATDHGCKENIAKAIVEDAMYQIKNLNSDSENESAFMNRAISIFREKLSDELTLRAAKKGSRNAENSYFLKLHQRLLATAPKMNGLNAQDFEDMVQETVIMAYENYHTLNQPLIPWAYKTLKNLQRNASRKSQRRSTYTQQERPADNDKPDFWQNLATEDGADPLEATHYRLLKDRLLKLAGSLKPRDNQILKIIISGGGRQDLIDCFPNVKPATIDTWLRRLRKKMMKQVIELKSEHTTQSL